MQRLRAFLGSPQFPIFMIVFVDVLGVGITLPVLPLYAQGAFHATPFQITLMASVYFAAQFFASPQLGRLSDRYGRRPILILSQAGTFLALLLSGAAPALAWLFVARLIDGLTGGNVSVAQAYLSDITTAHNRARGLGLVSGAFAAGLIFGPAFGALVAGSFGPRLPFFLAAAVSTLTVTLSWRLLPESLTPETRAAYAARAAERRESRQTGWRNTAWAGVLRLSGVPTLMLIGFLSQITFFSFQAVYVLWAEAALFPGHDQNFVQTAVGYMLTFVGVVGIITQFWLVGPLVRRFGERSMVTTGAVVRGLGWAVMAFVPALPVVLAVLPLIPFGGNVAVPALLALLTYLAPSDQRGFAIGLMESIQGLGRITGPLIAGWLFEQFHPSAPMLFAAVGSVLTVLAALQIKAPHHTARH
ncbi:MAG: MFS transporter [Anaerolineales bacterium]|nr:MFS transporter [Anaerolineales bacterium]